MRRVLAVGKKDAYYKERKHIIGSEVVEIDHTHLINETLNGGFRSCRIKLKLKGYTKYKDPWFTFYMIKLSKEK